MQAHNIFIILQNEKHVFLDGKNRRGIFIARTTQNELHIIHMHFEALRVK